MNLVINELDPKERALLYTSLLFFKSQVEEYLSESILNHETTFTKEFLKFSETESKALMAKLFGDCFPEDLDYMQHFYAFWKNQHTVTAKEISPAMEPIPAIAN